MPRQVTRRSTWATQRCRVPPTLAGGGSEALPELSTPGELKTVPKRPSVLAYTEHTNKHHDMVQIWLFLDTQTLEPTLEPTIEPSSAKLYH